MVTTSHPVTESSSMLGDYVELDQAMGNDFYTLDPNLRQILDRFLTGEEREIAERLASEYGPLIGEKIAPRAEITDKNGPKLKSFDEWGYPVNEIIHSSSWIENKADLVRHGLCGLEGYVGKPVSGVALASVYYLVCQAETAVMCGLGMTAGAADIAERYAPIEVRDQIVSRLRSLDPEESWEGGMFLTERQGGSDVGANTTRAVSDGSEWRIYGDKHFCSNVDADIFVVLARTDDAPKGSKGLATFLIPRHLPNGENNGFSIKRLKPKLGTVGVPTGEVHLEGSLAWLASSLPVDKKVEDMSPEQLARDGKGLNRMMEMVNGSRFGVALMGLGIHRRSFLEACIYAANRSQFGNRIDSYPLVRETLVDLAMELEAGMALTFECASSGKGVLSNDDMAKFRRILVPLAKMRATREGLNAASKALEIFGGNGYMEDWPMARQFRDAQCHPIWEGTENIICIDVRRAMRSVAAHEALFARIESSIVDLPESKLVQKTSELIGKSLELAKEVVHVSMHTKEDEALLHVRRVANLLADVTSATLLLDEAVSGLKNGNARKAVLAYRYAKVHLANNPIDEIFSNDRTVLDLFEPLVRYGLIEESKALLAIGID
ncbi:MAG: hypothetical protein HKL80_11230 [Acidimicrobiales bacterium]|nr:hypothetical protein [Acidimicrobiales bacterium]